MSNIYNPFKPHSPVFSWMFTWRINEIENIDKALFQTKNWNPNNVLLIGERWIWKTSLLSLAKHFSEWEINFWKDSYNFLTIQITLTENTTLLDLAKNINKNIERQFRKINPELNWIKQIWNFMSRLQVAWISLKENISPLISNEEFIDDFIYWIIDTIKSITENDTYQKIWLTEKKDWIVLLIDEWDKANKNLHIWSFLKILSEKLNIESSNKLLIIMAWLPKVRDILRESHESSLRLFNEYILPPLTKAEVKTLSENAIKESNEKSSEKITINKGACDLIFTFSEWYPHFVQQVGYSAFEKKDSNVIWEKEIENWFFWKNWALDQIWKRYYENFYYKDISSKSHREILWIMANQWNEWTKIKTIKKHFSGKDTTLKSWLSALTKKNIILKNNKTKWEYRLQWASFAFWINEHNKAKETK